MKRKLGYQVCYVIAALWATQQAASAAGIATVVDVVNEGYRTPPGEDERKAQPADDLVQEEALRTEAESVIQVKFVDGSELSVEAESEIVLSDYVFDPNGTSATGTINLNNGLFHFTSNGAPDQGIKLRTPVATIGVRGTEFLVHVDRDEATIIDILSGSVEAIPHGSGQPVTCYEGQSILIAGSDDDALCGDIGSFSTAAGPASDGPDTDNDPGQNNQGRTQKGPRNPPPSPPTPPDDGGNPPDDGGNSGEDGEDGEECDDDGRTENTEDDCECHPDEEQPPARTLEETVPEPDAPDGRSRASGGLGAQSGRK
jgi:hypothetical protein